MNEIKETIKKKAVIYCRVSTKEQVEEGNSLVTQERICKEFAFSNDFDVVEIYREQGESAKTADRTELQKLLAFCSMKKNGIKFVIIYKLDRLSRNTDDYSQLRLMLKRYGVEIKSTSEHFENTPVGRFMENTLANISQFDNDIRAERCSGGMKEAIREGRYVWKAPIGYDNVRIGGKATIAKNEIFASLILRAFEMVASNTCTVQDVYIAMTKEGLKRNGKPLVNSYFRDLLRNELYAGWINKFGERHKGLFEPIISEDLFNHVQLVLRGRGKKNAKHLTDNPDFPLRRFVFDETGKKLTGSWSTNKRKLKFAYYRFLRTGGKNLAKDKFEKAFMSYMDSYSLSSEYYLKLRKFIKLEYGKKEIDEKKEVEKIKEQINKLYAKQNALINKNVDGVIGDAILKQQLDLIEREIEKAQTTLFNLDKIDIDIVEAVNFLEPYFKKPSKVWVKSNLSTKTELQVFQFPLGCTFINNSFGTPKIRSVFKVKSAFLHADFATVDLGSEIQNTLNVPKPNKEINMQFWNEFKQDVSIIYKILKDSQNE